MRVFDECGPHLDEGADNEDTGLDCAAAVEDTRQHDGAMLGENVRRMLDMLAAL